MPYSMVALKEHFGAYDSNLSLGHALLYLNIWAQFLFRHHAASAIELMSFMLALFKLCCGHPCDQLGF